MVTVSTICLFDSVENLKSILGYLRCILFHGIRCISVWEFMTSPSMACSNDSSPGYSNF